MNIRLAFSDDNTSSDEMPTLIAAVDEYTEDTWGCIPDFYRDEVAKYKSVREAIIHIGDSSIVALFAPATLDASPLTPVRAEA